MGVNTFKLIINLYMKYMTLGAESRRKENNTEVSNDSIFKGYYCGDSD
jgi:hypothetical protein